MFDLSVILPSYEEDHAVIQKTVDQLTLLGAEVIVVDDGSKEPFKQSLKHGSNFGYGAALMTGIKNATRPLILTMDADNQHRTEDASNLYAVWKMLDIDMLIGARRLKNEKFIRLLGRKFLNVIASCITTVFLSDLNSGMRLFKRDIAMGYFPILCKQFSFTTSLTMSMMIDGYKVEWFPIQVQERANGKSRVKVVKDGFITLWYILKLGIALRTRRLRAWRRNLFSKSI